MLSKSYRFHGLGSVRSAMRHGQTVRGRGFRLKYLPSRKPQSRFAVIVSKKVDKRAVVRNRIRRRFFAAIEEVLPQLTQPFDAVYTVYDKELAELDWTKLRHEVHHSLRRAHIID